MTSILETGKDDYDADAEFDERTERAIRAREVDNRLFTYDAVEVESFVEGDFRAVVPVLAKLRGYRLLDLGCGYGRLAPFLSGFDCAEYLGVDRVEARIEYARERYGGGVCSFEVADILNLGKAEGGMMKDEEGRPHPFRFDVVWTSNVLQHFLLEDKLRLVETAKRARAPGGIVLMREAEILGGNAADKLPLFDNSPSRKEAEARYASDSRPRHMVPIPFAELAGAFRPLVLRKLDGIVWIASTEATEDTEERRGRHDG